MTLLYALAFLSGVACFFYMSADGNKKISPAQISLVITTQFVNLGYVFVSNAKTVGEGILANNLLSFDGTILPVIFLIDMLSVYKAEWPRWIRRILYMTGFAILILIWRESDGGLYFRSVELIPGKFGTTYKVETGPIIYFQYAFITITLSLMVYALIDVVYIRRKKILPVVIRTYTIMTLLLVTGYLLTLILDPTYFHMPFVYAICTWLSLYCNKTASYYDIEVIVSKINNNKSNSIHGYVAFNQNKEYLGCTEKALEIIPELQTYTAKENIETSTKDFASFFSNAIDQFTPEDNEDKFIQSSDIICKFKILTYFQDRRNKKKAYLFELTDETEHKNYLDLVEHHNEILKEEVKVQTALITSIQERVVIGLANVIDSRDDSTGGHVKRTSEIISILVDALMDNPLYECIDETLRNDIVRAAPMHDLGKLTIDNSILQKPGKLTDEEYKIMKTHSAKSAEMVLSILKDVEEKHFVDTTYNLARHHHERWDGKGYPDGLAGNDIPFEARIMAIADVYDALVSKRCYKEPMSFQLAYKTMIENMGSQFDPSLEEVFKACRPKLEEFYRNL